MEADGPNGLRRRKGVPGAEVPVVLTDARDEKEKTEEAAKNASPGVIGTIYSTVTAPVRGAVGVIANTLSPFAWADFMLQWVGEITPVRLKRLGNIFWNALSHITALSGTEPGKELGWATRNVVDSLVETIAAPTGQKVVMDAGQTFVRAAEAFDTPEARAAYTQFFKLSVTFLEALATEEGKDLFKNLNDFVLRLAGLANSPQTTLAVAEFVTSVCKSLQQEHETFARERMNDLSPFQAKDGQLKKRTDSFCWNEEFVLGVKSASQVFSNTGSSTGEHGEEGGEGAKGPAARAEGANEKADADPSAGDPSKGGLPAWDTERMLDITNAGSTTARSIGGQSTGEFHRMQHLEKTQLLKELFEASLEAAKAGEKKQMSEEKRAMMCALSFLVFSTYTIFALIGVRSVVKGVVSLIVS